MIIYHLWLLITLSSVCCNFYKETPSIYGVIQGKIMIGGLVAVHELDNEIDINCNATDVDPVGIQRIEAMRYAVYKINEKFPVLNFGMEIRDSCGSETRALDESLQFVIDRVPVCQNKSHQNTMFGVVGASTSLITAEVANLLRLFRIPLVSYAATSTGLSDRSKYDFLLRTVPPDSFQSMAMVSFIKDVLKWKSVFVLYSAGSYGEHGFESFLLAAGEQKDTENGLCIADSEKLPPVSRIEKVIAILKRFHADEENINGIVCYCEVADIRIIIEALSTDASFNNFRLIGSDNFVLGPKSNRSIIFSLHYNKTDLRDFHENWYNKLTPQNVNKSENPWFMDYWNKICAQKQNTSNCSLCDYDNVSNEIICPRDDKISYTIDAVSAFGHAVNDALLNEYNGNLTELIISVSEKSGHFLNEHLKKVLFDGVSDIVQFPSNNSIVQGFYDISYFDSSGKLILLATWKSGSLRQIKIDDLVQENFFGKSTCQNDCKSNEKRVHRAKECCWVCEKCKADEYLSNKYKCKRCDLGKSPNDKFNGCSLIPVRHINNFWKVIIYIISSFGIFATGYTIKTFVSYNDTPLVKASGRELSYVLLFGIMMLFFVPITLLVSPGSISCGTARFSIGLFLCICYGSLLVKTNRIARIFSGRQDLLFLTPNWQIILTIFILMPQILIGSIGLIRDPPVRTIDYSFQGYGIVKCNSETPDLIVTISYNLLLVFISTYYAFRTRKVPANFNEARYIGFVMYTTCVIWLAFLPVFFGTSSEYKTIFIMLDLIMNAATLLIGLFGIKIYIIILRPEKNSRSNSKLRSITFYVEPTPHGSGDYANGHVNIEAKKYADGMNKKHSVVRFTKSTTESTLVTDSNLDANTNSYEEKNKNITPEEVDKLQVDGDYPPSNDNQNDNMLYTNHLSMLDTDEFSINVHRTARKTFTL